MSQQDNYPNLTRLKKYLCSLGFYSKERDLMTIKLQGGFESFTHRATEDWEQRWVIHLHIPHPNNEETNISAYGNEKEKLDTVVKKAIDEFNIERETYNQI